MGFELFSLLGPNGDVSVISGMKEAKGVPGDGVRLRGVFPPVLQKWRWVEGLLDGFWNRKRVIVKCQLFAIFREP